jgi:hypothetical protein
VLPPHYEEDHTDAAAARECAKRPRRTAAEECALQFQKVDGDHSQQRRPSEHALDHSGHTSEKSDMLLLLMLLMLLAAGINKTLTAVMCVAKAAPAVCGNDQQRGSGDKPEG